ncbi:MAG: hypothetical protein WCX32_02435 [Clostridia bacterium]|jgi:hypothetical protein|nr:hypothetical protein [Clostridia bacterium]
MKKKENKTTVLINNFMVVVKHKTKKQIQRRLKWRKVVSFFKQRLNFFLHLLKKDKRLLCLFIVNTILVVGTPFTLFAFFGDCFAKLIKPNYFIKPQFFAVMLTIFITINFVLLVIQNNTEHITKNEFIKRCIFYGFYIVLCLIYVLNLFGVATILSAVLTYLLIKNISNYFKSKIELAFCIVAVCMNIYFFAVNYAIFMLN